VPICLTVARRCAYFRGRWAHERAHESPVMEVLVKGSTAVIRLTFGTIGLAFGGVLAQGVLLSMHPPCVHQIEICQGERHQVELDDASGFATVSGAMGG